MGYLNWAISTGSFALAHLHWACCQGMPLADDLNHSVGCREPILQRDKIIETSLSGKGLNGIRRNRINLSENLIFSLSKPGINGRMFRGTTPVRDTTCHRI